MIAVDTYDALSGAPMNMEKSVKDGLIAFEAEMAELFNQGKIKAPLHLAGGNEDQLIEIFRSIAPNDWVLGSWRAHYHCLLKGVPPEELKAAILAGRSIALTFPKQRILCSAIVGGIAPIAVGLAWGIKRIGLRDRVWCFLGDMSASTGIVDEALRYAAGHALPIIFVREDNGLSVGTKTEEVWGRAGHRMTFLRYQYELSWPHVGSGKWISF